MINLKQSKILLTGGYGFLGQAVFDELIKQGAKQKNITRFHKESYDLRDINHCRKIVNGINVVIHLAANFDGLKYNTEHAAEVFYDNAAMGLELTKASQEQGVKKFVLVGTVGSYPKTASIPYKEKDYWNGLPETGNDSYGLSKKFAAAALMAFRQQYGFVGINLVLANLYGPGDHFNLNRANVIPALIHKFEKAKKENQKELVMWGTGEATREFLHVSDAARAIVLAAQKYESVEPVNIGSGQESKIKYIAQTLSDSVGFKGKIVWDKTKPEGQKRRVMSVTAAKKAFGFSAKIKLQQGLKQTMEWFKQHHDLYI